MSKPREKEKAIKLRKRGYSYSEILKKVPVAKSTLSLWLRSVGLAKRQKQRLTEKRLAAARRGAWARREERIRITRRIKNKAQGEIGRISRRDLWMIGTALYWAEGAKEKPYFSGTATKFDNSDPEMIKFFLRWLKEILGISFSDITLSLSIHETADWRNAREYWAGIIGIEEERIRVYFKRSKPKTNRRNTGKDYHGLIRIHVNKSTNLNRKIAGWIEGVCKNI